MTREKQVLIGDDEIDITIETGTRKPAGVAWILRIRLDCDFVCLSPFQKFAQVDIEAQVSIVGTTDSLTVQIDIAHQHDALEVEHDALSLPFVLRRKFVAIPADAHLLESTGTQSAAHIAARIAVIRALAGIWSHPVLSYQEIMWQIHHIIPALGSFQLRDILHITAMELPSLVDTDSIAHRSLSRKGSHQRQTAKQQRGEKYCLFIHSKFI